jgi:hypothetical protein
MHLKAGDTAPAFTADTNADLTGASAVVRISKLDGTSVLSRTCTITDATNGIVSYQWVAGAAPTGDNAVIATPGAYHAEVLVTFAGGAIERFPQASWLELLVKPAISTPA